MATIDSLAADVYVLTNRPDLVSETKVALRKAIFKCHSADTFKRDLAIQRLQMSTYPVLEPDSYRYSIPLTEFPRFRRPKFLRYPPELRSSSFVPAPLIDYPAGFVSDRTFAEVSADNIFDAYKFEHPNYFYIAGSTITIKSAYGFDYLDFAYYQYPLIPSVTSDPITSWVCDQYPDAPIEEAAGTVFKMIGKDDESARYQTLFGENLMILRGTDVGEGV